MYPNMVITVAACPLAAACWGQCIVPWRLPDLWSYIFHCLLPFAGSSAFHYGTAIKDTLCERNSWQIKHMGSLLPKMVILA